MTLIMNTLGEFVEPEEPARRLKLRGGPDEEPRREPKPGFRLCDVCGGEFEPKWPSQRRCCNRCREAARRAGR